MIERLEQPGGNDTGAVWVAAWALPKGGGYGVRIRVGDLNWTMTPDRALAYAAAVIRAAVTAEHDAAVFGLLTVRLGLDVRTAGQVIAADLRPDRPPLDADTAPLEFRPGITVTEPVAAPRGVRPFVGMWAGGKQIGQFTPADCRHHATSVLDTVAAADLDSAFRRLLVGPLDLDEARASQVIASLAEHWPAAEEPRRAQ
jgi:hypothetical protein